MYYDYAETLESYMIDVALESLNVNSIIKKYPISYPKEMFEFQFDTNGRFDKSLKDKIEEFFYESNWQKRFNDILIESLSSENYSKKIKSFTDKVDYNVSINDFKIYLSSVYFSEYPPDVTMNNLYINIHCNNIDRYDAPGFPQLMLPILSEIVKNDIGGGFKVERGEYPTYFAITRPLNGNESKALQNIKKSKDIKKKEEAEKRKIAKALRSEKVEELTNKAVAENSEKFYKQSLMNQAMEIVKYFTFDIKYYYDNYSVQEGMHNSVEPIEKRIKLDDGEKVFKFNYKHPSSFNLHGKPVDNQRVCYVISDSSSNYKKLKKVYFLGYTYNQVMAESFNTYMKKKVTTKK